MSVCCTYVDHNRQSDCGSISEPIVSAVISTEHTSIVFSNDSDVASVRFSEDTANTSAELPALDDASKQSDIESVRFSKHIVYASTDVVSFGYANRSDRRW